MKRRTDFWWLVALEAAVLLSLQCWALTAKYAAPVPHTLWFGAVLVAAATVAMLVCHVGPALFASRFGKRWLRYSWIAFIWFGLGYIEWLGGLTRAAASFPGLLPVSLERLSPWSNLFVVISLVAAVTIAVWVKSWWKGVVAAGLSLGLGILVWVLATKWNGLWVRNQYFSSDPSQLDWFFIRGILVSAAPSIVIGWRIGQMEERPGLVWLSGFTGVWLPMVLSVAMASLATEAGLNMYWRPSLPSGFEWALIGAPRHLIPALVTLSGLTLLSPSLLSAFSLKELAPSWLLQRFSVWLIPGMIFATFALAALAYPLSLVRLGSADVYFDFASRFHEIWAWSLLITGASAGLTCAVVPRS